MASVSPPFNVLGAVLVSITLGGFFAMLVCVLICVCRMSHSIPTTDTECDKPIRQEGVRSCPEGRLDGLYLLLKLCPLLKIYYRCCSFDAHRLLASRDYLDSSIN